MFSQELELLAFAEAEFEQPDQPPGGRVRSRRTAQPAQNEVVGHPENRAAGIIDESVGQGEGSPEAGEATDESMRPNVAVYDLRQRFDKGALFEYYAGPQSGASTDEDVVA